MIIYDHSPLMPIIFHAFCVHCFMHSAFTFPILWELDFVENISDWSVRVGISMCHTMQSNNGIWWIHQHFICWAILFLQNKELRISKRIYKHNSCQYRPLYTSLVRDQNIITDYVIMIFLSKSASTYFVIFLWA